MKRDVDLARQLLLDIEGRGADCSVSVLRTGPNHDVEERVRYHLRLLIDAGLLKEVDRAANGVPCVRLTDAGHELIELSRSGERWGQAKAACLERTGGLSLIVLRHILVRWAVAGRPIVRRRKYFGGPYVADRYDGIDAGRYAPQASYRVEPFEEAEWDGFGEGVRYVQVRPEFRNGWRRAELDSDAARNGDGHYEAVLPDELI